MRLIRWTLLALSLAAALWWAQPARAQADPAAEGVIVRVPFTSTAALNALVARYDVWEVDHAAGEVVALLSAADADALAAQGVRFVIDTARTSGIAGQAIRQQAAAADAAQACYRTVDATYADLARLAAGFPSLARWIDIGDSWDKATPGGPAGSDLRALVVTSRKRTGPKFRMALMAGIHAREMTTSETAARFAERLVRGYGTDPNATWLLDYGELHLIAMANPDGRRFADQGLLWRKNTHVDSRCLGPVPYSTYGVDLNRNSSFQWNGCQGSSCSSADSCSLIYRGSAPASEPETAAIQAYLATLFPDLRAPGLDAAAPITTTGLFVSLHSYGELVLYPWGFTGDAPPNADGLRSLGQRLGDLAGYTACQTGAPGCLYAVDGSTDDWVYGELGVPSYTIEMGRDFFEACASFEQTVYPAASAALDFGFAAARLPYQLAAGPQPITVTVTPTRVAAGEIITLTATFRAPGEPDTTEPLTAGVVLTASYSTGTPAWAGGAPLPMLPADGGFDGSVETAVSVIDTTGWPVGRVLLFVEAQNDRGEIGITRAAAVDVVYKVGIGPIINSPPPVYFPLISSGPPPRTRGGP